MRSGRTIPPKSLTMTPAIVAPVASIQQPKMPEAIHALFADIAQIRNTILLNAPSCLPQVAPALIDAEDQIRNLWRN